ncbi:MAG: type VII toxin-antitoxin system HepT family RNase toxin [Anaerolineae bacterium]
MLDKDFIRKKLSALVKHLKELDALAQLTLAEYKADFVRRHAAEKVVELIVEHALDINRAIVEANQAEPPQTGYNTFLEMERLGILPPGLTARLASTTGLRNRLVHRYDEIDNKAVYHSLQPLLSNYRQYARLIQTYLNRSEAKRSKRK